jgi:sodium/potassium-transporting ATPase subunit beta
MDSKDTEVEYEPNNIKSSAKWTGKIKSTKEFVWNSSKGEFIGRTGSSWAKIGTFYIIFYACLAAFFAIMLLGFFRTLDARAPTQQKMYSLIKQNPGMGFRPMATYENTLIKFDQGIPESYKDHMKSMNSFLDDYYNQTGSNLVDCAALKPGETLPAGSVCKVNRADLDGNKCIREVDYGYAEGQPCVLLKINKIYDWTPAPFTDKDYADSEKKTAQEAKLRLGNRTSPDYIGISCEGENEADADHIGPMKFYPSHGFSNAFYPYMNQDNYRQPIVFVQFERPQTRRLIQIWCKLWASNIKHHKNDKAGSVHFELQVD